MAGNPKDSRWYSTPADARGRRPYKVLLSDGARLRLSVASEVHGMPMSRLVEALLCAPEFDEICERAAAEWHGAAAGKESEND